ncbi:NLI interacting factor-like phosphatase-domain-containing protein [Mrakia frigida]|uniref:Nem1-Spo7 phosphatase catalytic subunit NEM1 n=1 Tax=Mrakia frigida TaxID=29902 RepID=UPI003FCBF138
MDPRTQALDPRTQAIEIDPRSQAIDPSQLPYPPKPSPPSNLRPSPSFEFSPPSPIIPSPEATRPATRSRLLLLPNPLAESSGNSLLHPSIPNAPSTPPSEASSYLSAPLRKKTPFHKPKTLILDLDETLIHSTSRSSGAGAGRKGEGHMVEVFLGGRSTVYHVYKRPYVDYFLKKVSSWYTLVIFTASMQEYADPVIDWLDGGRGMFGKRLFRDSCVQHQNGAYIKDLSCLQEDLESICLIDNSPISYSYHQANGIPIDGWFSDPNDQALLDLLPVLDSLRFTGDVRHVLGLRGF